MLGYMFIVLHMCLFAALPTFTVTLKKFGEGVMVFWFSTPFISVFILQLNFIGIIMCSLDLITVF